MPRPDSTSAFLPAYMARKHRTYVTAIGILLWASLVLSVVALSMAFWVTEVGDYQGRSVVIFHSFSIVAVVIGTIAWLFLLNAQQVTARRTHIVGFASSVGAVAALVTAVMRYGISSTEPSPVSHSTSVYCTAASGVLLLATTVLARRSIQYIPLNDNREPLV